MLSPHRGGKESEAAGKKQGKTGKSHSEREPRGGGDKTGHQQSTSHQQEAPSDGLELSNEGQGEPEDDGLGNNETNYHFDWRNDGSANDHATGTGASQWSAWNGEWDVQYSLKGEGPEPGNPPSSVSHASKPPSKGKQHEPRQRHIEKHTEAPPEEPSSYDQSAGASASPNVVPHGYYGEPYQYDGQLLDQFSQVSLYGDPTTQDDYVPALGYEGGSGDYDALYRHGGQQAEPPVREEPESVSRRLPFRLSRCTSLTTEAEV
ncbi:hypothetical protein QBC33DRAFT_213233 [Phialemonium atrogriseum]|uniref:Uncharacterized protein n=1 Tax=Phialemonium atrogriseum TaxID=1093897 RepID=A0AAJ0BV41_9PEZI|nr:uncharacterized protein QBC33DRAFT_213233 [Phialemonium atrogriseum]KAK1763654.1 hypothetical protein QBC33DRAFT_213233 [Phialemonium atrogriseum]